MFLMWTVLMVAMMLPSAAPTILVFARIARNGPAGGRAVAAAAARDRHEHAAPP